MNIKAWRIYLNEVAGKSIEFIESRKENPNPEVLEKFYNAVRANKRIEFLTLYEMPDLETMDVFMVKGLDAGLAVKDDGDIVSVFNNSGVRGIAKPMFAKAMKEGGMKCDHFDGYLSGLYRQFGFNDVYEVYDWDEQYAPSKWSYEPVDIMNPKTSIYAEAFVKLIQKYGNLPDEILRLKIEDGFEKDVNPSQKKVDYNNGRPDVVMRRLRNGN